MLILRLLCLIVMVAGDDEGTFLTGFDTGIVLRKAAAPIEDYNCPKPKSQRSDQSPKKEATASEAAEQPRMSLTTGAASVIDEVVAGQSTAEKKTAAPAVVKPVEKAPETPTQEA